MSSFHRSDWLSVVSPIVTLLVVAGGYYVAYFQEKGKNRAAAEDIDKLTRAVEDIKTENARQLAEIQHQNNLLLEGLKVKNQLRLAAIDKRLQAHQDAFRLWRMLYAKTNSDDIRSVVAECVDWWERNCLYLEESARDAFGRAMWSANDHKVFLQMPPGDPATIAAIQKNWSNIASAGNVILSAVELPGLTEEERKDVERAKAGLEALK